MTRVVSVPTTLDERGFDTLVREIAEVKVGEGVKPTRRSFWMHATCAGQILMA